MPALLEKQNTDHACANPVQRTNREHAVGGWETIWPSTTGTPSITGKRPAQGNLSDRKPTRTISDEFLMNSRLRNRSDKKSEPTNRSDEMHEIPQVITCSASGKKTLKCSLKCIEGRHVIPRTHSSRVSTGKTHHLYPQSQLQNHRWWS